MDSRLPVGPLDLAGTQITGSAGNQAPGIAHSAEAEGPRCAVI
jgi:hypothetical protein